MNIPFKIGDCVRLINDGNIPDDLQTHLTFLRGGGMEEAASGVCIISEIECGDIIVIRLKGSHGYYYDARWFELIPMFASKNDELDSIFSE